MAQAIETVSVTVEANDTSTAEFDIPVPMIKLLEGDDGTAAEIVAKNTIRELAVTVHDEVHHGEGTDDEGLIAADKALMDSFEDQFGMTYLEYFEH